MFKNYADRKRDANKAKNSGKCDDEIFIPPPHLWLIHEWIRKIWKNVSHVSVWAVKLNLESEAFEYFIPNDFWWVEEFQICLIVNIYRSHMRQNAPDSDELLDILGISLMTGGNAFNAFKDLISLVCLLRFGFQKLSPKNKQIACLRRRCRRFRIKIVYLFYFFSRIRIQMYLLSFVPGNFSWWNQSKCLWINNFPFYISCLSSSLSSKCDFLCLRETPLLAQPMSPVTEERSAPRKMFRLAKNSISRLNEFSSTKFFCFIFE